MNLSQQLNTPLNDLIARRKKQQPQNPSPAKPRTATQQSRRRKVQLRRDSMQVLRQPARNVAGRQPTGTRVERRVNRRRGNAPVSGTVVSRRISVNPTARMVRGLRAVSGVNGRKHVSHPAVTASTRIIIDRDTNEQTIVLKRDIPSRTHNGHDMKGFKMANLKWCVCYKQSSTTLQLLLLSASSDKNTNY